MTAEFATEDVTVAGGYRMTIRTAGPRDADVVWYLHDEVSTAPGPVAAALSEDFRVIAPVHPGFADADRPAWVESAEDVADLYSRALDAVAEQDGPIAIVGASVGGWIGTELALLRQDRVRVLGLVGPLGLHVPGHPPADHWFMREGEREATLFADPANKPDVPLEEFIANEGMTARLGWNPRLASRRLAPRLDRLTAATVVVWGEQDRLLTPAHRARWAELLPDGDHLTVAGSGHYPGYEQPSEVAAAIKRAVGVKETSGARA